MATAASVDRLLAKVIAYYLPQFHPIPENDEAWGKGFTEWTNVVRARPLCDGHYQPQLPAELGFYDLRVAEILTQQAELAAQYGVYGFCYYYYWFDGRRVLEKPLEQMLSSGKPDFPFCLCWANENWTRRWDGSDEDVIIPQLYARCSEIIDDLIPYFEDERYIRIDNRALLLIYKPDLIPDLPATIARWREAANSHGIGLFLVACLTSGFNKPVEAGFDAAVEFPPHGTRPAPISKSITWNEPFEGHAHDYEATVASELTRPERPYPVFRGAMVSWDNTPRMGNRGRVFLRSSPDAFKTWLSGLVKDAQAKHPADRRFIFVNAWNEWAEGAHLEPDAKFGRQWLEACAEAIRSPSSAFERPTDSLWHLFPHNSNVRMQLSMRLLEANRTDEALEQIDRAIDLDGGNASHFALKGTILSAAERFQDAIQSYRQALQRDPKECDHHHQLGNVHARVGDWKEAIAAQRACLELMTNHSGARRQLSVALVRSGLIDEGIDEARLAISLCPQDASAHHHLGQLLAGLQRWQEAGDAHQQAIELEPRHSGAHRQLSAALLKMGNFEHALRIAEFAVELDTNEASNHYHLATVSVELQRWQQAADAARQAIQLAPAHGMAHRKLSLALSRLGRDADALNSAQQAVELCPEDAGAHHHLGSLYAALELWQEAAAAAARARAVALAPGYAMAHRKLSTALSRLGRNDEAIAAARTAVDLQPDDASSVHHLGNILATAKRWHEAVEAQRRTLELDPNHSKAFRKLSSALKGAGLRPHASLSAHGKSTDRLPQPALDAGHAA